VQFVSPSGTSEFYVDPSGNGLGAVGSYSIVYRGAGLTPLAVYSTAETYFHHVNNIDSRTFMTNHYGTPTQDMVFYPWGEEWLNWGGGGLEFADLAYDDTNLNVDFTEYRAMSTNMGRWHSPDPLGGDLTNPQSLNRYAYVLNNPTGLIDPLGLDPGQGSDPNPGSCYDPNSVNAACWSPGWPPPFWPPYGGDGSGGSGGGGPSVNLPTGNTGAMGLTGASDMVFQVVWDWCYKADPNFGSHRNIQYQLQDKNGNPINDGWYSYEVTNAGNGIEHTPDIPGTSVNEPLNKGGGVADPKTGVPSDGFNDHLYTPVGTSINRTIRQQLGVSQTNPTPSTIQNGQLIPMRSANGSTQSENKISISSNPWKTLVNGIGCKVFMDWFGSLGGGPK
jgi:RHS repeat-associated protein